MVFVTKIVVFGALLPMLVMLVIAKLIDRYGADGGTWGNQRQVAGYP